MQTLFFLFGAGVFQNHFYEDQRIQAGLPPLLRHLLLARHNYKPNKNSPVSSFGKIQERC